MREVKLQVNQQFYDNGQIYFEEYRLNGKPHNENGPAARSWWKNGKIRHEQYWINGKQLSKEEFENRSHPSL